MLPPPLPVAAAAGAGRRLPRPGGRRRRPDRSAAPRSVPGWRPPPAAGQHAFRQVTTDAAFRAGAQRGHPGLGRRAADQPDPGPDHLGRPSWSWARWTSGWVAPGQTFTQLVPTLERRHSAEHAVQVQARVRSTAGRSAAGSWSATWATRDDRFRRTSGGAPERTGRPARHRHPRPPRGVAFNGYQLRVLPLRTPASTRHAVGAVRPGSGQPAVDRASRRRAGRCCRAKELNVPRYSQMTHRGQYPQVRRRWPGLVLPDLAVDDPRLLPSAADHGRTTPG